LAERPADRQNVLPAAARAADGVIRITPALAIDDRAIVETFVRASGPGGQNVNKVATAVQLRFEPAISGLPPEIQERVRVLAGRRATQDGMVLINAQRHRTQERNRQAALDTLIRLIERAAEPRVQRVPTRPTAASWRRRRETKAHRSRLKQSRGPLKDDE
jgi:ribosome-associated protein